MRIAIVGGKILLSGGLDADPRSPCFHRTALLVPCGDGSSLACDDGTAPGGPCGSGPGTGPRRGGRRLLGRFDAGPLGHAYLASGRSFSSEDAIKITQALDAKGISNRVDDRKIVIAAEQYDQAVAVFAKLHVGPMTFEEIRTPPDWISSLVETPQDKERNERALREKVIEKCINDLDGVVRSQVLIRYPRPTAVRRNTGQAVRVRLSRDGAESSAPLADGPGDLHDHDQQRARAEPRFDRGDGQGPPIPRPEQPGPGRFVARPRRKKRTCERRSWRS